MGDNNFWFISSVEKFVVLSIIIWIVDSNKTVSVILCSFLFPDGKKVQLSAVRPQGPPGAVSQHESQHAKLCDILKELLLQCVWWHVHEWGITLQNTPVSDALTGGKKFYLNILDFFKQYLWSCILYIAFVESLSLFTVNVEITYYITFRASMYQEEIMWHLLWPTLVWQ